MNIDEILSEEDHADIIMNIFDDLLQQTDDGVNIDHLTPAARTFFCAQNFDAFMNSDGFVGFFSVSSPVHLKNTLQALEAVGARKMKVILEKAVALWHIPLPHDRNEREDLLLTNIHQWNTMFEKLNAEYLLYPDEMNVLLVRYAEKYKSDFN